LFLSFNTPDSGKVDVVARAVDNRLLVSWAGRTSGAPEDATGAVQAVGELAARLGWKFESVEQSPQPPSAEADSAGTPASAGRVLDRLL
jgi:hypothetical protein